MRGFLDAPRPGTTAGQKIFQVLGWAVDDRGSVPVDIEVDGEVVDRARLGRLRPDVADALGDPSLVFAGWECLLDFHAIAAGRRSLHVEALARARNGERVSLGAATVAIDDAGVPPRLPSRDIGPQPPLPRRPGGRLRILAVMQNLDRGGSQLILLERLRDLIAKGAEAVVVSPADGVFRQELESLGWTLSAHDDARRMTLLASRTRRRRGIQG